MHRNEVVSVVAAQFFWNTGRERAVLRSLDATRNKLISLESCRDEELEKN
jgi:hypothetical protein